MNFRRFSFRRAKGLACIILGLAILAFAPHMLHAATDISYDAKITYAVQSSGETLVSEDYTIGSDNPSKYLESITLSIPADDATNIVASYTDGVSIPVTATKKTSTDQGYNYSYQEMVIKFPRKNTGRGWGFKLAYNTNKLMDLKGTARTVYVPAIAPSAQQSGTYTVIVSAPQAFGLPHSSGSIPTAEGVSSGRASYSFTQDDLSKQAIALTFGDQTVYNVNFNFPLKNTSSVSRTMTITLPPDTSSQKVYINSLTPKPKATRLDMDGNVLADFIVPAHDSIVVKTDISAVVRYLEYDVASGTTKADIPADLIKRYTGATQYWQSLDPNILVKAKQISAGTTKVSDAVKATQKFVVDTLTYNDAKIKYNIRQGASKALQNPTNAVCLEYSDLMVALLRAQGIPARMPVGYAYTGGLKSSRAVSDSLHSWVEAYIPGVGWINVDPTWGEKFENYGKSDLDHFAFALWGSSDDSPAAVMQGSNDMGYQYEDTTISYVGTLPKPRLTSAVQATQWVVLPFVSILQYQVSGPEGVAGDNYQVKLSGALNRTIDLGSLAPSQQVRDFLSNIGRGYRAAITLEFQQAGTSATSLSVTKAKLNYLPMIVIMLLVFVLVVTLLVKWIIRRKRQHPASVQVAPLDPSKARSSEEILEDISKRTQKIKNESNQKD